MPLNNANLVDVRGVAATSQACHRGKVARVAAHDLDDEHPPLRAGGRLANLVTDFGDLVERRVAAERKISSGHVVADRRRQDDDRNLEFRKL